MPEIFDIVDETDRVIGQAPRAEVHQRRLKHRAVHILVFNSCGDLFIQKRAATKDEFPNRYDSSAAGHLDAGEAYDHAASRELEEELGLTLPATQWEKLFKIEARPETGWEFVWVYRVTTDALPVINPQEIESGSFWPWSQIVKTAADQPELFATGFIKIIRTLQSAPGFRIRTGNPTS